MVEHRTVSRGDPGSKSPEQCLFETLAISIIPLCPSFGRDAGVYAREGKTFHARKWKTCVDSLTVEKENSENIYFSINVRAVWS